MLISETLKPLDRPLKPSRLMVSEYKCRLTHTDTQTHIVGLCRVRLTLHNHSDSSVDFQLVPVDPIYRGTSTRHRRLREMLN